MNSVFGAMTGGRLAVAGAARGIVARSAPAARMGMRSASSAAAGVPQQLYQNVWRKSNILYVTYIVAGCVVLEVFYGGITNGIWDAANKGKLYKQIDWSKFKSEDDEEEEEE